MRRKRIRIEKGMDKKNIVKFILDLIRSSMKKK